MINYIIRRVLIGTVTLLLITFIVYGLIRNMPGTPLTLTLAEGDPSKKIAADDLKRLNRTYGLDKPWPIGYVHWLGSLLRFDLGRSFNHKQDITRILPRYLGPTLLLSIPSLFLAYVLSVPLGLYGTVRNGQPDERVMSTGLYMLYAIPSFIAGLLLLSYFAVQMRGTWLELPLRNWHSDNFEELSWLGQMGDVAYHMILPLFCYTYGALAYYVRFVKANMEEVVRQDYIRTARAKGVGPWNVIVWHAFRNTLIPFVTLLGLSLPGLVGGAIILERVFSWPGMGTLFIEALLFRDYPLIMAEVLLFSVLTLVGQLLADLAYAAVDPRIVYS
jgi:peptide/nickel transport system permease protein